MQAADIKRLLTADAFPHKVDGLELVETHISWVILTGEFAYKIKKPVDLGFVDFTLLASRKHFCEEELRLNQRTAPELYLDVVPIGERAGNLKIGREPAIEYAVRMRQFPADARLDRQLESGRLTTEDVLVISESIARFHASLEPKTDENPSRQFDRAGRFALDNFPQIRGALADGAHYALLSRLEAWTRRQLELVRPAVEDRVRKGFIRECHGDLHLANMVKLDGQIVLFDCIEFDPGLRWLDPMNDIAFLVMDFMAHGRADLALIFLNAYLETTGDYPGLSVLRFYLVYRCMVRAKVSALQPRDTANGGGDSSTDKIRRYLELARTLIEHAKLPRLFLMHGFSGAGKSWLSERLIRTLGAIRLRSDLERKRLHGLSPSGRSDSGIGAGLYDAPATRRTYERLLQCCEIGLKAGFTMIADASFLRRAERRRFLDLARRLNVAVFIVDCTAPEEVLRERIQQRQTAMQDVSEANLQVLEHQLRHHDRLTRQEENHVIRIATDQITDPDALFGVEGD